MMHWGNVAGMGFGGMGFGWIFMLLFWAFVILGVAYLLKLLFSSSNETAVKESAQDILKKRYAAGELTKEEYNDKFTVISGNQ
jgi:putative membrane protein